MGCGQRITQPTGRLRLLLWLLEEAAVGALRGYLWGFGVGGSLGLLHTLITHDDLGGIAIFALGVIGGFIGAAVNAVLRPTRWYRSQRASGND